MMIPPASPQRSADCRRFELLLGLANRGDLTQAAAAALAQHLAECAWCQAQQVADAALVAAMRRTFAARPSGRPLFTAEAIIALTDHPTKTMPTRSGVTPRRTWVTALVAVVVLAIITAVVFHAMRPLPAQKPKLLPTPTATDLPFGCVRGTIDTLSAYPDLGGMITTGAHETWAVFNVGSLRPFQDVLMHEVNGQWRQEKIPQIGPIQQVSVSLATSGVNDVWVAGITVASQTPFLARYHNGQWTTQTIQYPHPDNSISNVSDLQMLSPSAGWGIGFDQIYHYDGHTWRSQFDGNRYTILNSSNGYGLAGLQMLSPTNGWAILNGNIPLHYDGVAWRLMAPLPGTASSLTFDAPDDAWASGIGSYVLHYHAGVWSVVPLHVPDTLQPVLLAFTSANAGWAGGVGLLDQYKNGAWAPVAFPIAGGFQIMGFAIYAVGTGWAMGERHGGTLLMTYQHGVWSLDTQTLILCS